jgi:FKBP-type peptidyl-prolyl cis-trans isomerase FkpA
MIKQKLMIPLLLTGLVFLSACNDQKSFTPSSEDEKILYAVGAMLGDRFAHLELDEKEVMAIAQGLKDSSSKKEPQVQIEEYQAKISPFFNERMAKMSTKVREEGDTYRNNFISNEGASVTESGLAYKISEQGSDRRPSDSDTVKVSYHGTLIDGTVFDSSVERGQDVEFPLNRVIAGWTEGLQLIGVGGKIRLVIPPDLAYGNDGAPPAIPGGATLIFDVELKEIVEGGEEMEQ